MVILPYFAPMGKLKSLSRVTAAAFPLASQYATASSPAGDYACVLCLPHFV